MVTLITISFIIYLASKSLFLAFTLTQLFKLKTNIIYRFPNFSRSGIVLSVFMQTKPARLECPGFKKIRLICFNNHLYKVTKTTGSDQSACAALRGCKQNVVALLPSSAQGPAPAGLSLALILVSPHPPTTGISETLEKVSVSTTFA